MVTGAKFERTYRSGDKFKEADLEEQEMEYLYSDKDSYCFMNSSNYEQHFLNKDQLGDTTDLLKDNTVCTILLFNGYPIDVALPNFINLVVTTSEPSRTSVAAPIAPATKSLTSLRTDIDCLPSITY